MPSRATEFQTIRSEGGLLPPDLLRRIVDPAGKVSGIEPASYGLPSGERINEAITQSWNRLRRHWAEFRAGAKGLPEGDALTGLTNDKWSLPLLRELGFGFLATTAGPTIDGKTYAISRFAGTTPIHLIGCGVSLDHRTAGVRGAAAGNPHGLLQEFLNRSPGHLWAILSNGLSFRILRDSQALSRQSFLEFDLEAMFDGEVYSDFVLLWLLAHASRFLSRTDGRVDSCWLETWSKEAAEQGVAALTDLRGGVEKALEILGQGFVSHPRNTALRDALRKGEVKLSDFHHQLLRIVYRLIFLFVSEDRELEGTSILHPQDKSESARQARERYSNHYGTGRLRDLASRIKGSRHGDLWRQFQFVVGALSGDTRFAAMREKLALPALGSMLWNPASTELLNGPGLSSPGTELSNVDFLEALRHLAFIRKDKILRPVDYKNLGSEEFGGVYESFLALTPQISSDGARFTFAEFAGNERKTSGSYYTPDSLVQCLLDSALDPVVEARLADAERLAKLDWAAVEREIQSDLAKRTYVLAFLTKHAGASKTATAQERKRAWDSVPPTRRRWKLSEEGILALKACDMACGSGHFLVGAAHRLARHLARVRAMATGESEPSPLLYQTALRDVIGHCLYGVDINPMAVELCKVTLWLEALEPGKPLSFLDHHIRCGNSLLGATPELIAAGLPDEAFDPIEGDDKAACSSLKKLNRAQREGLRHLFLAEDNAIRDRLHRTAAAIDEMGDSRPEDIQRKEAAFRAEQSNYDFQKAWDLANLWCAAFIIKKQFPASASEISNLKSEVVASLDAQPLATQGGLFGGTEELPKVKGKKTKAPTHANSEIPIGVTTQHLRDFVEGGALPDGLLLEARTLAEQFQFFHFHLAFPEVFAHGGFDLNLGNPPWEVLKAEGDAHESDTHLRRAVARFTKASGRFPLGCHGKANTMPLFLELFWKTLQHQGRGGIIVKTVIATERDYRVLFTNLVESRCLVSLLDFENSLPFFDAVHRQERFCLITLSATPVSHDARFGVCLHEIADIHNPSRVRAFSADQLRALGGGVCSLPSAGNDAGVAVLHAINNNTGRIFDQMWCGKFFKMLDTTQVANDPAAVDGSAIPDQHPEKDALVPVYEGKFFDAFDHRAAGWDCGRVVAYTVEDKASAEFNSKTRFYFPGKTVAEKLSKYAWNRKWVLVYGRKVNRNNVRTMSAAVLPLAGAVDTCPTILFSGEQVPRKAAMAAALLNSFAFDYVVRSRLSGFTIGSNHLATMAIPAYPSVIGHHISASIQSAVLELSYTAWDLEAFAQNCGWSGPPFRWDDERRFLLRCELDAAFFHLYLGPEEEWRKQPTALTQSFPAPRDAVSYIMDTFPIVKRKDEAHFNGDYRTKRTILEIYDALQESIRTGTPHQTRLPIPAAEVRVAHEPRWPSTVRPTLEPLLYFQCVLPLMLRLQPGGIERSRLLLALELLTDTDARKEVAAGAELNQKWSEQFPKRFSFSDAAGVLLALLQDGTLHGVDKITLNPTAKAPVRDAWLELDAFTALRLAMEAGPEALQRTETSQTETIAKIIRLAA